MLRSEQPKEQPNSHDRAQPVFREHARGEPVLVVRSHPQPQPHPPSQERPPSARRASLARQRFARSNSTSMSIAPSPQASRVPSPTEQRPLSRYRILPSISRRSSAVSDDSLLDSPLSPSPHSEDLPTPPPRPSKDPARLTAAAAAATGASEPDVVLNLALRLPDGRRVQADFSAGQSLDALLDFALQQMSVDAGVHVPSLAEARRQFELLSAAERRVLQDWSASLRDLGILDRSLYILQESE